MAIDAKPRRRLARLLAATVLLLAAPPSAVAQDALPSWNDGDARRAIVDFVERVSTQGSADYVPPEERVAVFDNDGTLWVEQPYYTQLAFALDRVRALAPEHPEWQDEQPFQAALENDTAALAAGGIAAAVDLVMASHAGMTTEEFEDIVAEWLAAAEHPRFARPYTELVYQPMLELLDYLRGNGFKTFIVSGGGIDFMRPWTDEIYGVPPEQVVGSSIAVEYRVGADGTPALVRLPEIDFIDDEAGKPVGIHKFIGRRPILAVGNSDGDLEMLQWTAAGEGPRLAAIVRHDDAEREYAYDRDSHVGRLDEALDLAAERGWLVVSMQDDWNRVFAGSE